MAEGMAGTPFGTRHIAGSVALALIVIAGAALGTRGAPEPEPTVPVVVPAPPPPAPVEPAPAPVGSNSLDPDVSEAARALLQDEFGVGDPAVLGVRLEWPYPPVDAAIDPAYDRLAAEAQPWRWPAHFITPASHVVADEPFVERVVVDRDPTPCHSFHRRVSGVDTGVGGRSGDRMSATLLARLGPFRYAYLESGDDPLDDSICRMVAEDAESAVAPGFLLDQVIRIACDLPEREVRCFLVTRWFHEPFSNAFPWEAEAFVFDRVTGERLTGAALHPGLTEDEFVVLLRLLLHAETGFEMLEDVLDPAQSGVECAPYRALSIVPTSAGVTVECLDYESKRYSSGGLHVTIPWEVVRLADAATAP